MEYRECWSFIRQHERDQAKYAINVRRPSLRCRWCETQLASMISKSSSSLERTGLPRVNTRKVIYCRSLSHKLDLQKGRIFLAGNAARRMAPTGTFKGDHANEKGDSQAIRGFKMCTTCVGSFPWLFGQRPLLSFSIRTISSVMLSV